MRTFSRREFYDLVWSKPITELAKEFGLSGVTLHKTCKKHHLRGGACSLTELLFVATFPVCQGDNREFFSFQTLSPRGVSK